MTVNDTRPVASHGEMEVRVLILYGRKIITDFDLGVQFFRDLSFECFFGCFAFFYLTAGEFLAVLERTITTLRSKDTITITDNSCNNINSFHIA